MVSGNNRAAAAVRRALTLPGPSQTLNVEQEAEGPLTTVLVRYGDRSVRLWPIWAGEGFPQDVERALKEAPPADPAACRVVVARRLSSGSRLWLTARGLSWADEDGSAQIAAPSGLLVLRDAMPRPDDEPSDSPVKWAAGSAAVAELILSEAIGTPSDHAPIRSAAAVADTLGLSIPAISRALQQFDQQGWSEKRGSERGPAARRWLVDPGALLSSWAAWYSTRTPVVVETHGFISSDDAWLRGEVAAHWPNGRWALTGLAALDRRAPFTTSVPTIDLYLDAHMFTDGRLLDGLLTSTGLRRVDRGARVRIIEADRYVLRLSQQRDDIPQVNDVRLYGDLLGSGVRGPEAADHLRSTMIGF